MDRNSIDKKYQWDLSKIYSSIDEFKKDIAFVSGKLNNPGFVAKAPQKVIDIEKDKLEKFEAKLKSIEEAINKIQK